MRKINITIEIDDNDAVEQALITALTNTLGASMTDYQVLPDTKELYQDDSYFRKLCGLVKSAKRAREDYRLKQQQQ